MKYKFSQRCEALGDLAYKNNRKIKTHKNIKKYKLVGYVTPYYKYPADAKGLWVTPEQWEIRTWLRYVPNVL